MLRSPRLLYFSRGKGSGHAMPDSAIMEATRKLYADFDVRFVSYDTGAAALDRLGYAVIDLKLPEWPPFLETAVRAAQVIGNFRPDLVISHEDFAMMPMAKVSNLPTIFITHWFWKTEHIHMQSLCYADRILFIEEPGVFEEPSYVAGKVEYFGPLVRNLGYTRADRDRVRARLGTATSTVLVSVMPGSWTEAQAPLVDMLMLAFRDLPVDDKQLVWIAGADTEELTNRFAAEPNITVKRFDEDIGALMVASDLVITKANYTSAREIDSLSVPQVSISHRLNPIDDIFAERIATNRALYADELDADKLGSVLTEDAKQSAFDEP